MYRDVKNVYKFGVLVCASLRYARSGGCSSRSGAKGCGSPTLSESVRLARVAVPVVVLTDRSGRGWSTYFAFARMEIRACFLTVTVCECG